MAENTVQITRVETEVPAQTIQPRDPDADTSQVNEVFVSTDRVILDPAAPDAVQIPDAGKGSLDLPGHALADGTVEEKLDRATEDGVVQPEVPSEEPAPEEEEPAPEPEAPADEPVEETPVEESPADEPTE